MKPCPSLRARSEIEMSGQLRFQIDVSSSSKVAALLERGDGGTDGRLTEDDESLPLLPCSR
jgi:hypothetical protein